MAFEVFRRKSRPTVKDPIIGMQSRGTFSLNAAAYKLVRGDREDDELHVELLYDADEQVIGIRGVDPGAPNSYVIRKQKGAESYLMTGVGFLNYYGIPFTGKARHYIAREFDGGIVGFSLEKDKQA